MNADGSGGEFHIDGSSSKSEKRKSRPARPPPPQRRLSRPVSEIEGEGVDGIRPRTTSTANTDSGPPDSISCVRFACTFTKKNGMFFCLAYGEGEGGYLGQGKIDYTFCTEGPLHDLVIWYGINYAETQVTQKDFQNKGKSGWTGTSSFVLELPLCCNLRHSIIYSDHVTGSC